jgi:hypothetical protein
MSTDESKTLMTALAAAFDQSEVKFKPGVVSGNRALAIGYVDARVIQDRLDDVLGVDGWQDDYECLADGSVVCRLRLRLGSEWITKVDVGSPSEQPDGGDRLKAAFSDALKRAAVKFGIGRYLYRLPSQWVDYDPAKRKFLRSPQLPPEPAPAGKPVRKSSPAGHGVPGPNPATQAPASGPTITDEERQALTELLARKGKTVKAAMKSAGSNATELADLTREQYQLLTDKLGKLPDIRPA